LVAVSVAQNPSLAVLLALQLFIVDAANCNKGNVCATLGALLHGISTPEKALLHRDHR